MQIMALKIKNIFNNKINECKKKVKFEFFLLELIATSRIKTEKINK